MDQATIRRRLRALREARRMTQDRLAGAMGFNDRQTLAEIEGGGRAISFDELSKAAHFFNVKLDYFTDPLQLAGEGRFSWRRTREEGGALDAFEHRAGRWLATYRYLSRLKGDSVNSSLSQVGLTANSSFEEAWAEGEAIARNLGLGDVPASKLTQALETEWDTLVLYIESTEGVSGAACQLGAMNTVLINRREPEGRRNFDLAHEVFHLITWAEMPPKHIEAGAQMSRREKRIERLAENFAAGLLMPSHSIAGYIEEHPLPKNEGLIEWIRAAAAFFKVSGDAMRWRLKCLKYLTQSVANRIDTAAIRVPSANGIPPRFSRKFVETLGWGIETGNISVRKAADIVGDSIEELGELFTSHGLKAPFDL